VLDVASQHTIELLVEGQQILELLEDDQTALVGALVCREGKVEDLMQRAQSASIRAPCRQGDGR